jgi:hypothetical protein
MIPKPAQAQALEGKGTPALLASTHYRGSPSPRLCARGVPEQAETGTRPYPGGRQHSCDLHRGPRAGPAPLECPFYFGPVGSGQQLVRRILATCPP